MQSSGSTTLNLTGDSLMTCLQNLQSAVRAVFEKLPPNEGSNLINRVVTEEIFILSKHHQLENTGSTTATNTHNVVFDNTGQNEATTAQDAGIADVCMSGAIPEEVGQKPAEKVSKLKPEGAMLLDSPQKKILRQDKKVQYTRKYKFAQRKKHRIAKSKASSESKSSILDDSEWDHLEKHKQAKESKLSEIEPAKEASNPFAPSKISSRPEQLYGPNRTFWHVDISSEED